MDELEEEYELDGQAELENLSPGYDLVAGPYGPDPSGQPDRGSRLSRLALRFGLGIVVFAGIAFFSAMNDASRDGSGELVSAGDVDVMAVQIGDCFNDPEDLEEVVFSVAAVPCSEAHDNEVYSMIPVTGFDTAFPGDEALQDFGYDACVGEPFREYVGTDYFGSALEVFIFTPTEESWNTGDREVACILYRLDLTKLTGTARDSGL
ncbi:MAG: septum formation family protein [Acidimicrobiia bacterium]